MPHRIFLGPASRKRSASVSAGTPDAKARVTHHLGTAREIAKQLHTRALILVLPLLIATIAIMGAARPHLAHIGAAGMQLRPLVEDVEAARERVLDVIEKLAPKDKMPDSARKALDRDKFELDKKLALRSRRLERAQQSIVSAIRDASVEVSFPGLHTMTLPLFFASNILQEAILATLAYLWHLRHAALDCVDAALRECDSQLLESQRGLAVPPPYLLFPLPGRGWQGHVPYESDRAGRWQRLPVSFLLAVLCGMSLALAYLPARISDIAGERDVYAQLPLLISVVLVAATIGIAASWLVQGRPGMPTGRPDRRLRRMLGFALVGMLAAVPIALAAKPNMRKALVKAARERTRAGVFPHVRTALKMQPLRVPLDRAGRRASPLRTSLVEDGFLFNPASDKYHLVVNSALVSIKNSAHNIAAFARYQPAGIALALPGEAATASERRADLDKIANGHAPLAIERYFLAMLELQPAVALDFLHGAILSRLPAFPPSKTAALDLRLMDLYAKSCLVHGDGTRLEAFAACLRQRGLRYLLADRLDRWLDPKAPWRKRVLDYGRCSKQRYPVEGRCEFESRPAVPFRHARQWFQQGSWQHGLA